MSIALVCGHCGEQFTVEEEMRGLIAVCPKCSRSLDVPAAAAPGPLRLRRDAQQPTCPRCGATLAGGATVCTQCGQVLTPPRVARRLGPVLGALAALLLVAAIVAGWPARRSAPPAETSPATAPAAGPEAAPESRSQSTLPAPTLETPAAESNTIPHQTAAELRQMLAARLDLASPVCQTGETCVLREISGLVRRGIFEGANDKHALLKTEDGRLEVPLAGLDQKSRVRVDRAFREQYIEFHVQKRLQEL